MQILHRLRLPDLLTFPPATLRTTWTLIGCLAIPLWATWPLLAALTSASMPMFQYFAVIYASGAILLFLVPRSQRPIAAETGESPNWAKSSKGLATVMFGFGLLVSSVLFITAFDHIGVAQANLILYLWPVMVVALCVPLGLARPRVTHVVGIALGLLGAAFVIGGEARALSLVGVGLSASGGFVWAVYVVFRIWQGERAPDALAPGLAVAAITAGLLHMATEQTVIPSVEAFAGAVLVGIIPSALGNLAWDHGVRKGDKVLLSTMAYATPLVSALLLVTFGLAAATPGLVFGAALIVAAGVVASR